jgi:hypothetical protein
MSRVLKVSQSNYRLQTQSGGTITLDTGVAVGTVVVTGNLDVKGTTTTVESSNTTVKDNILQLNHGQTGSGISGTLDYQSGIEVERGSYSAAQILFNEQLTHYNSVTSSNLSGTFVLKTADGTLEGLRLSTIGNDGASDFVIDMQSGAHAILIANSPNYNTYVTQDNHIINKKYLTNYVAANNGLAVVDRVYYPGTGPSSSANSLMQAYSTDIEFSINQVLKATISAAGLTVNNVNLSGNTLTNTSTSPADNLIITAGTNNVEVNAILNLDDQSSTPASTSGKTKIYSSATAGPGKTGLYITNVNTSDELISKNRAVLYSILL